MQSYNDFMSKDPVSVDAAMLVLDAIELMRLHHFSSLLVTRDEVIVGIFTERDLLYKIDLRAPDLWQRCIGEFASDKLITATDGQNYTARMELMRPHGIRHLPVTREGIITGIVTLRDLLNHYNEYLVDLLEEIIAALSKAIGEKDPYTAGHQQRVARIACLIANELGWPEDKIRGLNLAAFVHDIGKLYVPLEILCRPGRLSENEFNLIREHPRVGYDILKSIEFEWPLADIVHQHHERLDGLGYPQGLMAHQILDEAKILSVADVFEAVSSHRPYRAARGISQAMAILDQGQGSQFDPDIVGACLATVGRYPVIFQEILASSDHGAA